MKKILSSILAISMLLGTVVTARPSMVVANDIEMLAVLSNLLENPGFESADMSMWNIERAAGMPNWLAERSSYTPLFGSNSIAVWDTIENATFTLEQTVVIPENGTYHFDMWLSGNDWPSSQNTYIYVHVNGIPYRTQTAMLAGFDNPQNPMITGINLDAGDEVTVGINFEIVGWAGARLDDFTFGLVDPDFFIPDPVASDIYVRRIPGSERDGFIRGVDIGSILSLEASGVVFRDDNGQPADIFELLAAAGVNLVRVRIWNDPWYNQALFGRTRGFGGGNNDVEAAMEIGRRATAAGMGVKLNFHYSDFWADPGKQISPRAWEGMDLTQRGNALHDFTYETVSRAVNVEGIDVWQVQLGNETNSAMAGVTGWNNMGPLFRRGSEAVRAVDPDIQIVIHFTNPEGGSSFINHATQLNNHNVDYDVFGASYYSFWHGTLDNLTNVLNTISDRYDVDVMVVETSWAYTEEGGDCHSNVVPNFDTQDINYPISVQGQANAVADVFRAVANVNNDRGIGVIYWEPAWLPVPPGGQSAAACAAQSILWETHGSGWASSWSAAFDPDDAGVWYGGSAWDNQALFDFNGNPLASLNLFNYIQTGTVPRGGIVMETVLPTSDEISFFEGITVDDVLASIHSRVEAVYINNARRDVNSAWSRTAIQSAIDFYEQNGGIHVFNIPGTVVEEATGRTFEALMRLTILPYNLVQNHSFESPDMSMWNINIATGAGLGNPTGNRVSRLQENVRSGNWGLNFFQSAQFDFTVEQEIVIEEAGVYDFQMFLQGGGVSEANVNTYIYVIINGEPDYLATQQTRLGGWMNWENPTISGLELEEGDLVTIGIRFHSTEGGAWGTFDDFFFFQNNPVEPIPDPEPGQPIPDPGQPTPDPNPAPGQPGDDDDNNQPPVIDQDIIGLVVAFLAEIDAGNPLQITVESVINHREILSAIADVIEEIDGLPDAVSIDVVSQENTIFTENKVENVTVLITMNPTYPIFDQTIYFEIVSADGDETLPQTSAVVFDVLIAGLALGGLGFAVVLNKKRDIEIN